MSLAGRLLGPVLFVLMGTAGCRLSGPLEMPELARARVTPDFATYSVRRVGIMPFVGRDLSPGRGRELQDAFYHELGASTPYELVLLDTSDVAEIERSEPFRRGWYKPRTIIRLSKRYNLDAIFFGTVTHERFYSPLGLSLQTELVAAETGLVLWSSTVQLDAADPRVADGLQLFYGPEHDAPPDGPSWHLALLSPERLARFAAYQVARLL